MGAGSEHERISHHSHLLSLRAQDPEVEGLGFKLRLEDLHSATKLLIGAHSV